jgi:hypothetical protein
MLSGLSAPFAGSCWTASWCGMSVNSVCSLCYMIPQSTFPVLLFLGLSGSSLYPGWISADDNARMVAVWVVGSAQADSETLTYLDGLQERFLLPFGYIQRQSLSDP